MKKLLAVLLTLTMLVTLPAFGASAEGEVGGADGVTTFDPTTPAGEHLNVKVTDITHKYAVDLVYSLQELTIGGTITWNVNTMKYDVKGTLLTGAATRTVTVSNRSDLPVYAYATISNTDNADGITVTADKDSATNKLEIGKANPGNAANDGTPNTGNLTINLTSGDWNAVAEYYAKKRLESTNQETDTFRIATVTVTISKD